VSIKSGGVKVDIAEENVLQPLLVSTSAVELASETVKMILRSKYPCSLINGC